MSSNTTIVSTSLILTGPSNWFPWFSSVKNRAVSTEIWDLVNPEELVERINTRPTPPSAQTAQQLSSSEQYRGFTAHNILSDLTAQFNREEKDYSEHKKALQNLQADIQKTISANLNIYLNDCTSPYQALRSLKQQLAPTAQARLLDVTKQYQLLCAGKTKGQNSELWLDKWQALFSEATEIKHPDFQTTQARMNFMKSASSIDLDWSVASKAYFIRRENKGKSLPSFQELLQELKQSFRTNEKIASTTAAASSFPALQGKQPSQQRDQSRNKPREQRPTPTCPVEETNHWYSDCPYLNPSSRPTIWTPNPAYTKKAEALMKDPILKGKVDRSLAGRKAYEVRNTALSELSNTETPKPSGAFSATYHRTVPIGSSSNKTGELPANEKPRCFPASFFSSDDYTLKNAWILDSGSNIHLCNDPNRFHFQKGACPEDTLVSGKTTYQIEAFGTAEINITTPNGGQDTLSLKDVALVPGFMTNLVSFSKAREANIHWDTVKNTLYTFNNGPENPFCQLHQQQGHTILENSFPEPLQAKSGLATPLTSAPARASKSPRKPIEATPLQWHYMMGHPGTETVANLSANTTGTKLKAPSTQGLFDGCVTCRLAKAKKLISRRPEYEYPATKPLERIHYDLIPFQTGYNGDVWVSHFICATTRFNWLWTHRTKDQATHLVETMINLANKHHSQPIRYLHSDGERSLGTAFTTLIRENGIQPEKTAPHTSDQNGLAERSGGLITTIARCMRISSNLPADLWPETVAAAAYLLNRTPTKALGNKTPYEALYKRQPSLAHLHKFGCRAYALIRPDVPKLLKLQQRAHLGYLVGYDSRNIFRIWLPSKNRTVRARDVTFDEQKLYKPSDIDLAALLSEEQLHQVVSILEENAIRDLADNQTIDELDPLANDDQAQGSLNQGNDQTRDKSHDLSPSSVPSSRPLLPTPSPSSIASDATSTVYTSASEGEDLGQGNIEQGSVPAERSTPSWSYQPTTTIAPRSSEISSGMSQDNILPSRTRNRTQAHAEALANLPKLSGYHSSFALDLTTNQRPHRDDLPAEPKNWRGLLKHPHRDAFMKAAYAEFEHLNKRGTFQVSYKPGATTTILPLIWVFKYKFDTDGYLEKHKARLCVRGDLQKTDQDTAAATLAYKVFRALMALAASFDLESRQYDAVNAFINSLINEEIHVSYPEGIDPPKSSTIPKCLLLLRALYGLKQSPLLWLHEITGTLEKLGLKPVPGVECLFTNDWLIVFFYVDDFVMLFDKQHQVEYDVFEAALLSIYELRILGELSWFLGTRIIRERSTKKIWLCQDSYIEKLASKFPVGDQAKTPKTPLPPDEILPYEDQATPEQIFSYQQRIGSITFAATSTRPDVAFASSRLAQFLQNPSPHHLALANRLIAYLTSTKTLAIEYNGQLQNDIFVPSSDAAYADDSTTRKSSYGYLFQLYGGPIDWKASKQITVTTSSTEAELLALSETARQNIWWNRFFKNIHFETDQKTTIVCDNQQTLDLVNRASPKLSTRLKHVDVHRCWLRQEVQNKNITTKWIPTAQMPADGLTKALPRQKHEAFVHMLQLTDLKSRIASTMT